MRKERQIRPGNSSTIHGPLTSYSQSGWYVVFLVVAPHPLRPHGWTAKLGLWKSATANPHWRSLVPGTCGRQHSRPS